MSSTIDPRGAARDPFAERLTIEPLADGVRCSLPPRTLGKARHLGWLVIAMGLVGTAFMVAWMAMPIRNGIEQINQEETMGYALIAFGLFGLIGLVPMLGTILAGFAIVMNRTRCVVELRGGRLRTSDRFFFLKWPRKHAASDVARLRLMSADDQASTESVGPWLGDAGTALVAETTSGRRFAVAAIYPRELLHRLADELAPRLDASLEDASALRSVERDRDEPRRREPVEVVEGNVPPPIAAVPRRPASTAVTIERPEHGISIRVPPVGVWKGSKGLIVFCLLWNGFCAVFLVISLLAATGAVEMEGDGPPWIMAVMILPFIAVGVGLTLTAINMGRRHAEIVTAYDSLLVIRHTLFGKKVAEWTAAQIDEVVVGPSGVEMNDVPVMELQIHPKSGSKFGCLSQLDRDEMDWIAAEINAALPLAQARADGVAADAERDASGDVVAPPGSGISIQETPGGKRIIVPPRGMSGNWSGVFMGGLFATIGIGVTGGVSYAELRDGFKADDIATLLFLAVWGTIFIGAGLAMFCVSLLSARREFQITMGNGELSVLRIGPLARRTFRWPSDQVQSVEVVASGTRVNNRALHQVKIVSPTTKLRIMTGCSRADLATVATAINDHLSR